MPRPTHSVTLTRPTSDRSSARGTTHPTFAAAAGARKPKAQATKSKPSAVAQLIKLTKHAGTTTSHRGRRRAAAQEAAKNKVVTTSSVKIYDVPKSSPAWQPVLRDLTLKLSSSFGIRGVWTKARSLLP